MQINEMGFIVRPNATFNCWCLNIRLAATYGYIDVNVDPVKLSWIKASYLQSYHSTSHFMAQNITHPITYHGHILEHITSYRNIVSYHIISYEIIILSYHVTLSYHIISHIISLRWSGSLTSSWGYVEFIAERFAFVNITNDSL